MDIRVILFNGINYRSMVYINSYSSFDFPSNIFKNGTDVAYFIRKIPLNTWTSINIDVGHDAEYFANRDSSFCLSLLSIGPATCNGSIEFLLRKAETNYNCPPWAYAKG